MSHMQVGTPTTCPKCQSADVVYADGFGRDKLHECEGCGHTWDELERLRAEVYRLTRERALLVKRSGYVYNDAKHAWDRRRPCACTPVLPVDPAVPPLTLRTLLAGQPSPIDAEGRYDVALDVCLAGEDLENDRMLVRLIDWAEWVHAGWHTKVDTGLDDLTRLRDALSAYIEEQSDSGSEPR